MGTSTRTGPGWPLSGQVKSPFHHFRQQFGPIHPPGSFDKGAVDFELAAVRMEVDFLVRMFAKVMGRHVTGDHHHGNAVQRRIGHAGDGHWSCPVTGESAARRPCRWPGRIRRPQWAAICSCRTLTKVMELFSSTDRTAILVCPQRPNICLTPRFSRYSTSWRETSSFINASQVGHIFIWYVVIKSVTPVMAASAYERFNPYMAGR